MSYAYKEAYSEVLFILQNMSKEDVAQIPNSIIETMKKNSAKHYKVNLDTSIPLEQQNLKEETKAVLAVLYRKFWAEGEEKAKLEKDFLEDLKHSKKAKVSDIQFSPDNGSKKISCDDKVMIEDDKKVQMIVYKPLTWYQKLLKRIKEILK